jgi:hypothetical protein
VSFSLSSDATERWPSGRRRSPAKAPRVEPTDPQISESIHRVSQRVICPSNPTSRIFQICGCCGFGSNVEQTKNIASLPDMTETAPRPYWTNDTIGSLIDDGYELALYCENYRGPTSCGFVKWVDLEKLAAHLGRDHSSLAPAILPHMHCTKCGGKKVSVRLHPPTLPRA